MNTDKINKLVARIRLINNHFILSDRDILLEESRDEYLAILNQKYGAFLQEKLFEVYDDYFEDSELEPIQHYLYQEGVSVEGDEFGELAVSIQIKSQPLRIEVVDEQRAFQKIVWQAA
ncbi:MAG: hypothetical protein AB8B73_15040 [Ekhidna sp.]